MTPDVTVITITRGRPQRLLRAIESVRRQRYDGELMYLIVVDDCAPTSELLSDISARYPLLRWHHATRDAGECSGPQRLGKLRNLAVAKTETPWVAFLDDDNYYEPVHIDSLVACARANGVHAVHSERWLHNPDGSPYLEQRMPWKRDPAEGRRLYTLLRDRGVFVPGSNVVHDRADPRGHPHPVRMVDTSEWLLSRRLLLDHAFCEQYTVDDWEKVVPEDKKLLQQLIADRVPIASSRVPTLHYQLGGYSNAFDAGAPVSWARPGGTDHSAAGATTTIALGSLAAPHLEGVECDDDPERRPQENAVPTHRLRR